MTSGAPIEFRGSQTGDVPSEFPREVDGLLVEKGGTLEVVYTAEKGTLKPVTEDSVNAERLPVSQVLLVRCWCFCWVWVLLCG